MHPRERLALLVQSASLRWSLTSRQRQVLHRLALGAANKDIAAELRCSVKTVEAHVTAILGKAGAESRASVVARLWLDDEPGELQHGLNPVDESMRITPVPAGPGVAGAPVAGGRSPVSRP